MNPIVLLGATLSLKHADILAFSGGYNARNFIPLRVLRVLGSVLLSRLA